MREVQEPVSYTHLDVYKRQGLDRVGLKHNVPQGTYFVMIDISDFLALPQFKGCLLYTSDVYKRQGLPFVFGAGYGTRTRRLLLGKQPLYRMS